MLLKDVFVIVCRGNWHGDVAIKELNLDEESDSDNTAQLQAFKLEVSCLLHFYDCHFAKLLM